MHVLLYHKHQHPPLAQVVNALGLGLAVGAWERHHPLVHLQQGYRVYGLSATAFPGRKWAAGMQSRRSAGGKQHHASCHSTGRAAGPVL